MAVCEITGEGLFLFEEGKEPICLISFWDYYSNLGAMPLHAYNSDSERVLPRVLRELQESCGELTCMLAVAAVFRQSLLGYRPLRVLIAGGGEAMMAILEKAAWEAHPESRVHSLGGDGEHLRDSFFDLAVIGEELSGKAIGNVLRATRVGGSLANVCRGRLGERRVTEEDRHAPPGPKDEMRGLRAKLLRVTGGAEDFAPERLGEAIRVLGEMERLAIEMFDIADIDLKQRIIEAKENALNALYTPDEAFRAARLDELRAFLKL
jgi:hypothetical protein